MAALYRIDNQGGASRAEYEHLNVGHHQHFFPFRGYKSGPFTVAASAPAVGMWPGKAARCMRFTRRVHAVGLDADCCVRCDGCSSPRAI